MIESSRGSRIRRVPVLLTAALLALAVGEGAARAQVPAQGGGPPVVRPGLRPGEARSTPTCERCHGELEFLRQHTPTLERARQISVSDTLLRGSGHDFACSECHKGFSGFPHDPRVVETTSCASCHPSEASAWSAGVHASVDKGNPVACKDCHGIHAVPMKAALKSKPTVRAFNDRCLGCHDTRRFPAYAPHSDSVPCFGCHGPHDIRPHDRQGSMVAAQAQVTTCGACHPREAAAFRGDVHGRALLSGRSAKGSAREGEPQEAPGCTGCHGGHGMVRPKRVVEAAGPGAACTRCHEKYGDTFADSYHGQATKLGSKTAAGCAGCHTAHSILPADSARSSVAKANLVSTCRQCHPNATASFTAFQPHADLHDRAKSPLLYWTFRFMTILLTGTMTFFGLHTALWLARSLRSGRTGSGQGTHAGAPARKDGHE